MREPVDAVITWVDGTDKTHVNKLANYFAHRGIIRPEAAAPTRYNQCGEIAYCVHSILCFAPWIRTIYIVTDAQTPPIMEKLKGTPYASKVKLIDHRDIFRGYEQYLPTFNSLTIEMMLWRIDGLSENFIYLNDDCAIIRPVLYEDFFRGDKLVLRGHWKVQTDRKLKNYLKRFINYLLGRPKCIVKQDLVRTVQENSAKLAGWYKYCFHFPHAPFALQKKLFADYFLAHPEEVSKNISYAIRDHQQFWLISLLLHLEIKQKNVIFDNALEAVAVNGAFHSLKKIKRRLALAEKKDNVAFICMQSVDAASEKVQNMMLNWLDNKIIKQF